MSAIGPYDGRKARRKRCNACVKRKIKCHGGVPCDYCKKSEQPCESPIKPTVFRPVFVGGSAKSRLRGKRINDMTVGTVGSPLMQRPTLNVYDESIPYFFMSFLAMNSLSNDRLPVVDDLLGLMKDGPALRDAISAVALHHRKQQTPVLVGAGEALQPYNRSVCYIKKLIASNSFLQDPSALWTTFFLGLYELMRDSTGTTWLSHFLHGTCAMLQLLEPNSLNQPGPQCSKRRVFFLNTRIFEISRSLIYSEPTFLWEPRWIAATEQLWEGNNMALWHPKEALFDMLPGFSELSIRTLRFVLNASNLDKREQERQAQSLADEGLGLQNSLQGWYKETQYWTTISQDNQFATNMMHRPDTELMLSYAYYHAISIYLSGTYDYHRQWSGPAAPCAPILSRDEVSWHVSQILEISRMLLALGTSGIFLFFPLRVAGARTLDRRLREVILGLFKMTSQRGFLVAEALITDLSELWG